MAKKPEIKNAKIGSICEGLIARNQSIAAFFNAKATPEEKAEVKNLSHNLLMDSLGLATGAIRVEGERVLTGFFAGWTTPFAVACGLFTQGLFAFLAATYLTLDTAGDPALQNDFRLRALISGASLAPVALGVFALAAYDAPHLFDGLIRPWAPFLLVATSIAASMALVGLYRRRFAMARAAAIAQVTLILLGWGFAQFPYLVPTSLTYQQAAGPRPVVAAIAWALAAGSLVLLPSLRYLFRTFKSREGMAGE